MDFHIVASPVFQRYLKFGHKLSGDALFMTPLLHSPGGFMQSGDLSLSLSLSIYVSLSLSLSLATVYIISLMV